MTALVQLVRTFAGLNRYCGKCAPQMVRAFQSFFESTVQEVPKVPNSVNYIENKNSNRSADWCPEPEMCRFWFLFVFDSIDEVSFSRFLEKTIRHELNRRLECSRSNLNRREASGIWTS
jgi:hypothetical protein